MNGDEFVRRVRKLGRRSDIKVAWKKTRGKGSHGALYYGRAKTTVKHGEISEPLLRDICKQLGIDRRDL